MWFRSLPVILSVLLVTTASFRAQEKGYTESLMQDTCDFTSTGRNTFFILEPGYQLTLEDKNGGRLVITVLDETKRIGSVETRVVEENESKNGRTLEISRNFFAICKQNGGAYYFGEAVDIYKNGNVVDHEGAWEATGKNRSGLAMPGLPLVGSRYYQEIAPQAAMDRAEVVGLDETLKTPAGTFAHCLKVLETNPLEPGESEFKIYAPGVGLVKDEDMLLVKYGFVKNP